MSNTTRRTSRQITETIDSMAGVQHGMVSTSQLVGAGISAGCIVRRVDSGRLFSVCPRVYTVHRGELSERALWMGGVLAAGTGALLAGNSAAALLGFAEWDGSVDVRRPWSTERHDLRLRASTGRSCLLRIRRYWDREARRPRLVHGIPVVCASQALLELAETWPDAKLKWAYIEADRLGLLTPPHLARLLGPNPGYKGAADLRKLAKVKIPRLRKARSLLEGMFLDLCVRHGLATPEVNEAIGRYRADFRWREESLVVEVDGGSHRGHAKRLDDHGRENDLVGTGWSVLRFDWWDIVERPDQVAAAVGQALESRRPTGRVGAVCSLSE